MHKESSEFAACIKVMWKTRVTFYLNVRSIKKIRNDLFGHDLIHENKQNLLVSYLGEFSKVSPDKVATFVIRAFDLRDQLLNSTTAI